MEKIVSIIIPTFNGSKRISNTINSLLKQDFQGDVEIIVVNDGSIDETKEILNKFNEKKIIIRIIDQNNSGPAKARNNGVQNAKGNIILFIDDDCIPEKKWISKMLMPFEDNSVVAAKGAYKTNQKSIVANFVQLEYENKYSKLRKYNQIDTIDTYSAAFRKDIFIQEGGFDETFPVACAEDFEFSFRLSGKGYKMVFIPDVYVYHQHPDKFSWYLKKKYKFAYWRWLAIKKNPSKLKNDTHTPQSMKFAALFSPFLLLSLVLVPIIFIEIKYIIVPILLLLFFFFLNLDFQISIFKKNKKIFFFSPLFLFGRALSQFCGILNGYIDIFLLRKYS